MAAHYQLKATGAQFMFNLKAGNNETILTSERYTTKAAAEGGIGSVRTNSPSDHHYERKTSKSSQPYFILKAGNGALIGTSEMYSSTSAMENGIESCKRNGPSAVTKDET